MRKLVVSEWLTLDGIFDADSMEQWFMPFDSEQRQEYIINMMADCGGIIFGRTTYEELGSYWAPLKNNENGVADYMNNLAKYVVSSTLEKADWNNTTILKENIAEEITKLKQQQGKDIILLGSATLVQSLMEANLIDEYRLLVQPIIIGSGKRFFKDGMNTKGMELINTQKLDKGVILLSYQNK